MKNKHTFARIAVVWIGMATCGSLTSAIAADTESVAERAVAERAVAERAELTKDGLLGICETEEYAFTSKLRKAFLAHAKEQAFAGLKAEGKSVPKDFLAWIDSDPEVEAGVYGVHNEPCSVLLWMYSLRLDLGKARFEKYRQLALATAIVSAKQDMEADITPREPLKLVIHGDPRKPIDTKEPGCELDKNDHIINFLNDNTIEEDSAGEKRKRSLYACDVLADKALQTQFNAYMKSKGHPVDIDCGDRIVHWKSRDAVHGEQNKNLTAAYKMFRAAYEAKGYLPAARDPIPSPAERCVYIIRNYEYVFPKETRAERKWPQFPITAPWPVLTLLVDDDQPLREREERWIAFRDQGEFIKYGEYIGAIAQQFDIQSARRLKPHPFTYHTIQMMLKDGGVCGTMGAISARSHISLGIPACQAIQPGHCAMVAFRVDAKETNYICKGGQYATGGDEKTTPFARWYFGDDAKQYARRPGFGVQPNPRKPMVYHQSIAWAVNYGMSAFLDSTMAYNVYRLLDEPDRKGRGRTLLTSGLAMNPYNFLLTDAAQEAADTAQRQLRFWQTFQAALQAGGDKSGCPADGLYSETVRKKVFARIAKLPVPENKQATKEIYAFLQAEKCDLPAALLIYRLAIEGLPALLTHMETEYKNHLISVRIKASRENDSACARMAASLTTSAACIEDEEERTQWALKLWKQAKGREKYFGRSMRVSTDPSISLLAKQAGQRMPDDAQLMQSLLDLLTAELKDSVAGRRDVKNCSLLADKIKAAAKYTKDPGQKDKWTQGLAKIITGHETFRPQTTKKNAKALRDPCADAVEGLLAASENVGI